MLSAETKAASTKTTTTPETNSNNLTNGSPCLPPTPSPKQNKALKYHPSSETPDNKINTLGTSKKLSTQPKTI